VIIWGKSRAKFKNPEETYRNKSICVSGRIGKTSFFLAFWPSDQAQGPVFCSVTEGHDQQFGVAGSLKLPCGKAALRKPGGMAPAGEGSRASVGVLSARVRLRNRTDDFLGKWWDRSDLPV
jgi:hypothetical protein